MQDVRTAAEEGGGPGASGLGAGRQRFEEGVWWPRGEDTAGGEVGGRVTEYALALAECLPDPRSGRRPSEGDVGCGRWGWMGWSRIAT